MSHSYRHPRLPSSSYRPTPRFTPTPVTPLDTPCSNCDGECYEDESHTVDDELLCDDCFNDNYAYCESCNGEAVHINNGSWVHDYFYCSDHLSEYYNICHHCDEYVGTDYSYWVEDQHDVCEECYNENYSTCEECDEPAQHDNFEEVNGIDMCKWCADQIKKKCYKHPRLIPKPK